MRRSPQRYISSSIASARRHSASTSRFNVYLKASEILQMPDPIAKARETIEFSQQIRPLLSSLDPSRGFSFVKFEDSGVNTIPNEPTRSDKIRLVPPNENPNARESGVSPVVWLIHSIAHIEMNAIELTWDTILRFHHKNLPLDFVLDFISIANDEARHFELLCDRLKAHGSFYGQLVAHAGLWTAADRTREDFLGRLGAIQLVQEPRALDSADRLSKKMVSFGDVKSSKLMELICKEEINHVRIGVKWFKHFCEQEGLDPIPTFHNKVKKYVGIIPPPFNEVARQQADMSTDWYMPVSLRAKQHRKAVLEDARIDS